MKINKIMVYHQKLLMKQSYQQFLVQRFMKKYKWIMIMVLKIKAKNFIDDPNYLCPNLTELENINFVRR